MEFKLITRAEAKAQGLKRYYTGKPCPHGHVGERYVSSRNCLTCHCARNLTHVRKWRAAHPERSREIVRKSGRKRYAEDPNVRARKRAKDNVRRGAKLKAIPLLAYLGDTERKRKALRKAHHATIDAGSFAVREYVTDKYWHELQEWESFKQQMSDITGRTQSTDHELALANGGEHCVSNFSMMPRRLNSSKGVKLDWTPPEPVFESVIEIDLDLLDENFSHE